MVKKVKLIIFIILAVFILWGIAFFIDYTRYINDQKPIFIVQITHYDFIDGYINRYTGLGYIYFEYRREHINENSLVPFWAKIKK